MPTSFPSSNDSFSVPSSPSTTPTNSAGDSTRAHWESHRDLGDAVVALEQNVSLTSHNHSGTGARATPKLAQANTHESPDTDVSVTSLHHTIGTAATQALSLPVAITNLDPRYVKLDSTNQTIGGVKTFSSGPVITDLSAMKHNHSSDSTGGKTVTTVTSSVSAFDSVKTPSTTFFRADSKVYSIPANIKLTGFMIVDHSFLSAEYEQVIDYNVYLAPTGKSSVDGTFIANEFGHIDTRWPGGSIPAKEYKTSFYIAVEFAATGSARNNYSVYVTGQVGAGVSTVRFSRIASQMTLAVSI